MRTTFITGLTFVLLLLLGSFQALPAMGADKHPTCQETSTRVFKPFLDRLTTAQNALAEYEDKLSKRIQKIRHFMARLRQSKEQFDTARDKDLGGLDQKIKYMFEAIDEIRRATARKIAELRQQLAKARAANNKRQVASLMKAIQKLSNKLSRGEVRGHKKELGWGSSINGWRKQVNDTRQKRNKRASGWTAGKIGVHIKFLGYTLTWSGVEDRLVKEQKKLTSGSRREPGFHLSPLGYTLNGKGIDKLLQKRVNELKDARARIAAGTFTLHVRIFGYTTDRNRVQAIMDKAKAKRASDEAAWGRGTYKAHSHALGYTTTNGKIQETIAKKQADLAAFIAAGDKAKVHVLELGYTTSGEAIRKRLSKAKNPKDKAYWSKAYGHWRRAIEKAVKVKRADIKKWQEILAAFKVQWREDLDKQQVHIDTTLTWALGETPCGGGSGQSDADVAAGHRGLLGRISETMEESRCRRALHGDTIFITKSGVQFGSTRDALLAGLSGTEIKDPSSKPKALSDTLLEYKNMLDYLLGSVDTVLDIKQMAALNAARQNVQRLLDKINKLPKGLQRTRAKLFKTFLKEAQQLLKSGAVLSESQLTNMARALSSNKLRALGKAKDARRIARTLRALGNAGVQFNRFHLPRLASVSAAVGRVGAENIKAARAMLSQNVGGMRSAYNSLPRLDRALFIIAVANAGAEMKSMMNGGKSAEEAGFRAATNLTIDLVLGGVPLTAAAEAATQIAFNTIALATGDKAWSDATLSNVTKTVAQWSLDKIGDVSAFAGTGYSSLIDGTKSGVELTSNVSRQELTGALARVQAQLNAMQAGDARAARLMQIRARLRRLLRARDGLNCEEVLAKK